MSAELDYSIDKHGQLNIKTPDGLVVASKEETDELLLDAVRLFFGRRPEYWPKG